jgi:peptidoglycan/LPS O-acetylase OafA/YrhL
MAEPEPDRPAGVEATTPGSTGVPREIRPDLEGLRGVAVVGVLLFHLGAPWAAGGFVGVDAFFVLSGFLITGLILRERERTGRISLVAFYARRVRRILPAALVTIVVTIGAATIVLAPLDIPTVALDGAAAALSVGNIRSAIDATDYFGASTPSPFRHFWSLGVEEQFYLLWPALLIVVLGSSGSRRRVALVIAGIVGVSLAAAVWLTAVDQPWAFYSYPTRAWQLGLGGLLAVTAGWVARRSSLLLAPVAVAGLAGLVAAFVIVDAGFAYPGLVALLPTVATAAVIAGGDRRGPARWLLGLPPVRWFGRISYSLYLWHWPILVLPVLALGRELSAPERLALAAIAIGVGALSWRWIEEPFRRGWSPTTSRRQTLLAGVGAMAICAAIAVGVSDTVVTQLDATASAIEAPSGTGMDPGTEAGSMAVAGSGDPGAESDPVGFADPFPAAPGPGAPPVTGPSDEPAGEESRAASAAPTGGATGGPPGGASGPTPTATPASSPSPSDPTSEEQPTPLEPAVEAEPENSPDPSPTSRPHTGPQPLPADVTPKLTSARKDSESIVRDHCSLSLGGSKPPVCVYGVADAPVTVALVGDSHAAHWFPALEALALDRGWRLVPFTKHSCTFVDMRIYSPRLQREYTECEDWRTNVVTALKTLAPDLVVVTSHRWFPTIVAGDQDATRQGKAMARLLAQLPGRIALLADTPISRFDVPSCLSGHLRDVRKCATDRAYAFGSKPSVRERVAAEETGAAFVDLSDVICPGDGPCPVVIDGMIAYRDDHHLTATFAAALAPILGERLPALGAPAP